ncbi:MAG: hypothetical protein QXZ17_09595 [Nitrososphaerota archaeon]
MSGEQKRSNNSSIIFHEPPGNYTYTVTIFNKNYSAINQEGFVFVTNNMNITVLIIPVTYEIEFLENGLSGNQSWSVTVGNNTSSGAGDSLLFSEMNGTYHYVISPPQNYSVSPSSGNITVNGTDKVVDVTFTSYVYVLFQIEGLSSGDSWSIVVNGFAVNTSLTSVAMKVPASKYYYVPDSSGKFMYYVSLTPGYQLTNESAFNASSTTVSFVAVSTGSSGGFSAQTWYYIPIVILVIVVVAVAFSFNRNRRGKK